METDSLNNLFMKQATLMNTLGERCISRFLVNNDFSFYTELYDLENRLGITLTMILYCVKEMHSGLDPHTVQVSDDRMVTECSCLAQL